MSKATAVAYLKIPGVAGPAIKKGFEEQIPVFGYQHAMALSIDPSGLNTPSQVAKPLVPTWALSSGMFGRVLHAPFVVHKTMDRATVLLLQALDQRTVFKKEPMVLSVIQSVQNYGDLVTMKISFTNAFVVSVEYEEHAFDEVREKVSFSYESVEWSYEGFDEAGKRSGAVSATMKLASPT